MPKHKLLVVMGVLVIIVGVVLFSQTDAWTRSWAEVTLHAGVFFLAAGLGAWALVDVLRERRD